jgi:hypothetical protein
MKSKALIVAGLIAAFSFGCGKSPEKICKKMADFAEQSEKGDKKKKSSKDDMDDCVKEMTKLKEKNPEAYKKIGECADLKDSDTAATCIMGVMLADAFKDDAKDKKAKADDDDDSSKTKKAAKKSSDDDDDSKAKKKSTDDDDDSKAKKKKSADDDDK